MLDWLLVMAGGLVGAPVRYLTGVVVKAHTHSAFPYGTLAANAPAALLLGFFAEAASDGDLGSRVHLLVATGFCGALSTWSTFSYELLTLASTRRVATAGAYLSVSVGAGVGLSFAGAALARAAW
ncbi:CrcB family protein [Streptomyces sp. BE308]|uniref:fluoride efflux transporter FluC n=1 Tax=unclassified Streptomyces TaxID=2593676 RepID=UPI002DDAC60F|nr:MULTISPECIES: CrcB family protein [unclassified Streptomyces]MEE1796483.1 CrcB family protein [Streptomyces sp. BE308]WRZ78220.1 CrcB family protein [Streptomyces sp. NBC_01237]